MKPIIFNAGLPLRIIARLMDWCEAFLYGLAIRTAAFASAFTASRDAYQRHLRVPGLYRPIRKSTEIQA